MKKQILILSLFFATTAVAQDGIPKGSLYGGLGLGLYSQKTESEHVTGQTTVKDDPSKNFNWSIAPEVNYFIMNNLAIMVAIGMYGNKYTSSNTQGNTKFERTNKSNGPSFNFGVRKFWNCANNFYTFAGLNAEFGSNKGEDKTDAITTIGQVSTTVTTKVKSESKNTNIGLNMGFAYHVSPTVMLIGTFAILSYYSQAYKYNIRTNPDSNDFNKYSGVQFDLASRNLPFNMGFLILLNNKKNKK